MALISLVKGLLGTGLLGLPFAFQNSGLYVGLAFLFVIILLNIYCMREIVKCAHYYGKTHNNAALDYGML